MTKKKERKQKKKDRKKKLKINHGGTFLTSGFVRPATPRAVTLAPIGRDIGHDTKSFGPSPQTHTHTHIQEHSHIN